MQNLETHDCINFKIILVGDGGTGKTSFVDRLNDGRFKKEYIATIGIEKHEISLSTSLGVINILIFDTSGQETVGPLRDNYYLGVDAAILFYDVTSRITYKNIPQWHQDILRICSHIPIALCANKIDINPKLHKVKTKSNSYHQQKNLAFFEISVKERKNLKDPLEYILQQLMGNKSLKITGSLGAFLYDNLNSLSV